MMKKQEFANKLVLSLAVLLISHVNQGYPQNIYPPKWNIPVTFYDFHSNGSNPEFERPYMAGAHLGMVAEPLDMEKKPLLGSFPYLNYGIAKWFRPWQGGDFTASSYQKISGGEFDAVIAYNGMQVKNYDTSYKNITINDTLPFTYIPGSSGTFEFSSQDFYPLDGKGFGSEGQLHNYSFTMECHTMFTCLNNQVFTYEGFDDIWVFVNGKLVLDMGGIHSSRSGQVKIDSVPGLVRNQTYPLDIFWTQRHSPDSKIRVTANLFLVPEPVRLFLNLMPRFDTLAAGDSAEFFAQVIDDTGGFHPELDSSIQWSLVPVSAGTTNRLRTTLGGTNTFYAMQAYTACIIAASYYVVSLDKILRAFDTVYVKPAPAYRLFIEPYTAAISPVPNPVDSLVILATETQKEIAAVVRYKLGNFFRFDTSVTWESGYSGIVQVRTPDKPYICRVERVANVEKGNSGTTFVLCKKDGLTIATVRVVVRSAIIYAKCLERLPVFHTPGAAKKEFYNLRGQKLPLYGIRHTDGIVLERIIEPSEKASIRKIVPEIKSR